MKCTEADSEAHSIEKILPVWFNDRGKVAGANIVPLHGRIHLDISILIMMSQNGQHSLRTASFDHANCVFANTFDVKIAIWINLSQLFSIQFISQRNGYHQDKSASCFF